MLLSTVIRLTDYQTVRNNLETNLPSFRDTVKKAIQKNDIFAIKGSFGHVNSVVCFQLLEKTKIFTKNLSLAAGNQNLNIFRTDSSTLSFSPIVDNLLVASQVQWFFKV